VGDAFVVKINDSNPLAPQGSVVYATYLGSNVNQAVIGDDMGTGITVDGTGSAWVTGWTADFGFPVTANAIQSAHTLPANPAQGDVFVSALNPGGTALTFSTYFGGTNHDEARGIALTSTGRVYVTGQTFSADFPVTAGAHSSVPNVTANPVPINPPPPPYTEAFLFSLSTTPTVSLVFSTYFGGMLNDAAYGVTADANSVYIAGMTESPNGIAYSGSGGTPFSSLISGMPDAFLAHFNPAGQVVLSTYIGGQVLNLSNVYVGTPREAALGVDLDGNGSPHICGYTEYIDFPIFPSPPPNIISNFPTATRQATAVKFR
jgi:hypothetical protein